MIAKLLIQFTYVGLFGILLAAGIGAPVSEDVALLTSGYLVRRGYTSLPLTLVVGYLGVVLGDVLAFRLGRALGGGIFSHPRLSKLFTPRRRAWIEGHFARRGVLTVVIGRHAAGLRMPTFLVAGASGMRLWKFVLADALSSMLTVPLVVYLGYLFAENLERFHGQMRRIELWGLAALIGVGVIAAAVRWQLGRSRSKDGLVRP